MPWREAGITSQRLEFVTLAMAEGEEAGVLSGSSACLVIGSRRRRSLGPPAPGCPEPAQAGSCLLARIASRAAR